MSNLVYLLSKRVGFGLRSSADCRLRTQSPASGRRDETGPDGAEFNSQSARSERIVGDSDGALAPRDRRTGVLPSPPASPVAMEALATLAFADGAYRLHKQLIDLGEKRAPSCITTRD
jgi:hypothetical protein